MANRRISELQELAGLDLVDQDLLTVVHVDEVDPTLKNRKLTISGTRQYLNTYYLQNTGGTISGALIVQGNLTVSGSTNFATATFTGVVTVGSLIAQSGVTVSGTISGATITGSDIQGTNVNGVLGNFTTLTGGELNFTTGNFLQRISGVTITGASGAFTSLTGQTITGTIVNVQTITGSGATFTTLTGNTAGFTTVTGATVTGTSGNFVSGVFTSSVSGLTVVGVSGTFTSLTGTTVTGTTANFTSGKFSTLVSGLTVTGTSGQFTTVTGVSGGFTIITGATVTGTIANFVTLSGTTVTGNAGQFTTLTGVDATFTNVTGVLVSGVTVKAATGVFTNLQFSSATVSGDLTVLGTGYFQSGVSVTGTISGITVTGTSGQFGSITGGSAGFTSITGVTVTGTTANFVSGVFTTQVSGAAITGDTAGFTTVTGTTVTGTTANFVSGVFTTQISGTTITGNTGQFTNITGASGTFTSRISGAIVTGNTAGFTTITGTTVTGTTANFVSGVFTTQISGVTVTGTTANFTSGNFIALSGTTTVVASGVFGLGSAAAPSIAFSGDPNTGIYSPGADQVAISTNGVGRLFVDSSGRVGVGTSSPSSFNSAANQFVVGSGSGSQGVTIYTGNSAGNQGSIFFADGTTGGAEQAAGYLVYEQNANYMAFGTLNTERMRLDSSGRLGIGTNNPQYLVDAVGSSPRIRIYDSSTGYVVTQCENTSGSLFAGIDNSTGSTFGGSIAYQRALYSTGAYPLSLFTNSTRALTIDSSQRVGIGTTGPGQKLDVADGDISITKTTGGDAPGVTSQSLRIKTQSGDLARLYSISSGSGGPNGFGGDLYIQTKNDNGALADRVFISRLGNVGIGTNGPGVKVDILSDNNTSLASVLRVNSNNVAVNTSLAYDGLIGSGQLTVQAGASSALIFGSSATEKARIDSSGRLLVGTSSVSSSVNQVEVVTASSGVGFSTYSALESALRSSYSAYAGLQLAAYQVDSGAPYTKNVDIVANSDGTVPSQMRFLTKADGAASPTERMRITSTGQSIFFTASTSSSVITRNAAAAGTSIALLIGAHSATGISDGTNSFIVWTNGNVVNTNNSYGAISDVKLKENIVDANSQWDDLKALQVRNYNFKEGQTHTQIGLVAQEVELVSPGLVSESPDRDEEGNDLGTVTKAVNYSVLYMKAVKALQEAMERIESLETRLSALEAA